MSLLLNLDGVVGPNHNYAGLAQGNLASQRHKGQISSPRSAALQGLEKMWLLQQKGIPQAILAPQQRPDLTLLHSAGFTGSAQQMLDQAFKTAPHLLFACYSSSSMWAANSATVTASQDSRDGKLHFTPANLISSLHRSRESLHNGWYLQHCFNNPELFTHHPALPAQYEFADEGAANHIRLSDPNGQQALNLFIYGREAEQQHDTKYVPRQSRSASESLIRRHSLPQEKTLLIQQHPDAINSGAFHNDVVAVGLNNFLLLHQQAFVEQAIWLNTLEQKSQHWQQPLHIFEVSTAELSLNDAIDSYLFNSQLVPIASDKLIMLAPFEAEENKAAYEVCQRILAEDNPVCEIQFLNLRQSMHNGGGPACLRLGIPITEAELACVHPQILLDETLYLALQAWIKRHYRDQLSPDDLRDAELIHEIYAALEELSLLLRIPKLYAFQH